MGLPMWLILSNACSQIPQTLFRGVWVSFSHSAPFLTALLPCYKRKVFPLLIPNLTWCPLLGCKILQGTKQKGHLKILFGGGSPH